MFTDMTKILDTINRNNDHMFYTYKEYEPTKYTNKLEYQYEEEDGVHTAKFMFPGVEKSDLDISVSTNNAGKNILKIKIFNIEEYPHLNFNTSEFKYKLPKKIDLDNVDSEYSNGLLTLIFNKKQDKQLEEKTINI